MKEYEISEKIIHLGTEWLAAMELRDKYMERKSIKKALKISRECENCRMKFWNAIYDIYPGLDSKKVKYDWKKQKIIIDENKI